MEEFEKYLIQLGLATGVNLMRGAKRSTARDFRLTSSGGGDENQPPRNAARKRKVRMPSLPALVLGRRCCDRAL